jgi:hypothetical protein
MAMELHIYGQGAWHDDAYIIGDREAIIHIMSLCDKALTDGKAVSPEDFFVNDGEGYFIKVAVTDKMIDMVTPYHEYDIASDTRKGVKTPEDLFKGEKNGRT